jgi:hypothetical protein
MQEIVLRKPIMPRNYALLGIIFCIFSVPSSFAMQKALVRESLRRQQLEFNNLREKLERDCEDPQYFIALFDKEAKRAWGKSLIEPDPVLKAHYARAKRIYLGHVRKEKKRLAAICAKIDELNKSEQSWYQSQPIEVLFI